MLIKSKPALLWKKLGWLFALQLMLVFVIPLAVFHIQSQQLAQTHLLQLTSMAHQKANQIESWLNSRLGDASMLQKNLLFIDSAIRLNHEPNYKAPEINETFSQLQRRLGYESLSFFDRNHQLRTVLGNPPETKLTETSVKTSVKSITIDWFQDRNGQLHMGLSIPLRDPNSFFVIGTLLLTQTIQSDLLPRIEVWPPESKHGVTHLLQADNNHILSIDVPANDALHTTVRTLPLFTDKSSLLAKALDFSGNTYHGPNEYQHDVFASYQPIGYTGWHVLLQQDKAEVLAPLYTQAYWIALLVFIAGSLITLFIYMQWRHQEYGYELEYQRQMAEKDRLLRHFFELPLFGMAITHSLTGRWIRFNDQFCHMLGYTHDEINQLSFDSLLHSDDAAKDMALIHSMEQGLSDGYQREKRFIHKDGHIIYTNVDTRCVRADNKKISFIISVVEDISLRKMREKELRKKNNLYNMLSRTNQSIVHCENKSELFQRICKTAVDDGGFSLAMIGKCTIDFNDVTIINSYGDNSGFCDWITQHKRYSPELIPHTGIMQAIHQKQNIVINNYLHEMTTSPFHQVAKEANIQASGYYLIYEDEKLFGALALYANEPEFFTESVQTTLEEMAGDVSFAIGNLNRDQQLVASERLFHNLTSFVRVGIFRLDLLGRLLYINEFGASLLRLSRYIEREPRQWLRAVSASDRLKLEQEWLPSLLSTGESESEAHIALANDQTGWIIIHARAETNAEGQTIGFIGTLTDITKIKETEARLKHQAHYDPLTQLPNRALLAINLQAAVQAGISAHKRLALLILDLDRFKDVNDSFGHHIGDVLLQEVARRLQHHMQMTNHISRLGGDEFTILLDNNPPLELVNAMAYDIIQLMKKPFHLPNDRDVILGASIGISLYPDHGATPEELLQKADAAMYHAKANGRSCFKYYSSELTGLADQRLDMEIRLKRAIEKKELRVFYQPQVDMNTNKIIGAEALVRWQDPLHGLIPPIKFIPLAEETGLIKQIGEWVLQDTCRQGKLWLDQGLPPLTLAVNISPIQFHYNDLFSTVMRIIHDTGYPAHRLELELTESALMEREQEAIEILNQLKNEGVRLAIDDFGTGYSSLSYLKRLPLDVLKIDKSFVDDIPNKKDDMEIAATIVAMAHTLRLKVLAEGVETNEQFHFLKDQGCDIYQGYLMSKPVPAEQFELLLRKNHDLPPA